MVSWILIVATIVLCVLAILVGIFFVFRFQMPEDKNTHWLSKIVIILTIGIAGMNVLMLPLDALNRQTTDYMNTTLMCWIFTIVSAVLAFLIIPYLIGFYEASQDEDVKHPICRAIFGVIPFLLFAIIFLIILYFAVAVCEVPVTLQAGNTATSVQAASNSPNGRYKDTTINITPSPISFIVAMIGFIGYLLLIILGGIGFATLPTNLITDFIRRPKPISLKQYAKGKQLINRWAEELVTEGEKIREEGKHKGFKHRKVKRMINKYSQQIEYLENAYQTIEVSYKVRGGNPVIPWVKLILGIVCIIISLLWIIHIIIFTFANIHPFLNDFFHILDNKFALSAVIFFGLFTYYLFLCVVSGATSFGLNLLFIRIHPMEQANTPINSILFNSGLMLFASFGVALFSTLNFPIYTRLTALDMIYGVQIRYLRGLKYVWEYAIYAFLGIFVIALFIKCITCNRHKDDRNNKIRKALDNYDTKIASP